MWCVNKSVGCYKTKVMTRDRICIQKTFSRISKAELVYTPVDSMQSGSAANQKRELRSLKAAPSINTIIYEEACDRVDRCDRAH
jgi:hypothetical protein